MELPDCVSPLVRAVKFAVLPALLLAPLLGLARSPPPPPSDAEVDRLLLVMRVQSQIEDMLLQHINESQEAQLAQLALTHDASDAQIARLQRIDQRRTEAVLRAISPARLRPIYLQLFKRSYSHAEVIAITEFYQSPAGQNLLDKGPALMMDMMEVVEQSLQPLLTDLHMELQQFTNQSATQQ